MAKKGINWNFLLIIFVGLILGWFYWFQYRPAQARRKCYSIAVDSARNLFIQTSNDKNVGQEYAKQGVFYQKDYDHFYQSCLNLKGIR